MPGCSILFELPQQRKKQAFRLAFVNRIGFEPMTFPAQCRDALSCLSCLNKKKASLSTCFREPDWIRTNDLPGAMPGCSILFELPQQKKKQAFRLAFVNRIGFEPMTCCLEGSCSIQLSYRSGVTINLFLLGVQIYIIFRQ